MSVSAAPRLVGILAMLFAVWRLPYAQAGTPQAAHVAFVLAWVVACGLLASGRSAWPLVGVCAAAVAWPEFPPTNTLLLVCWTAVVLAVARDDAERGFMLRMLVTSVYVFAVVSKLNPAWLAGDQLVMVVETRTHLAGLEGIVADHGAALAWGTVLAEALVPVGLWLRPRPTAMLGILLHLALVVAGARSIYTFAEVVVLNGLLVVGYLAFLDRVPPEARPGPATA